MMQDFNRLNIANLLETIVEQYQGISRYEGSIPRIEIDLMMENIRKLYDATGRLERLKPEEPAEKKHAAAVIEEKADEKHHPEEILIEALRDEKSLPAEEVAPLIEAQMEEEMPDINPPEITLEKDEISTSEEAHLLIHTEPQAKTEKLSASSLPGLFDSVQAEVLSPGAPAVKERSAEKTGYETIAKNAGGSSIIDKMQRKAITDLRSAIGINEKFSFINELFKGDAAAYNSAIDAINSSDSKQDADKLLLDYTQKYNWNKEVRQYITLTDLVERRFLP